MNLIQTTTVELTDEEWTYIRLAIEAMDAVNKDERFASRDENSAFSFMSKAFERALENLFGCYFAPALMNSFDYLVGGGMFGSSDRWDYIPQSKREFEAWAAGVIERKR